MSPKVKKKRADALLVSRGLCEDLDDARKRIMAGQVRIGEDHVVRKGTDVVAENADLHLVEPCPYVSRGAFKLLPALEKFAADLTGKTAIDVGASTGGFTDLMLQRGASKVYTVDVGRGQLHGKLRNDPRVVAHEQVNARTLPADFLPEQVDILTMDVSFISVTAVLPATGAFLKPAGIAFILVKPQFEAAREDVPTGGVVTDETVRMACVDKVITFCKSELQWQHLDTLPSPIKGPKGNQEFITIFRV